MNKKTASGDASRLFHHNEWAGPRVGWLNTASDFVDRPKGTRNGGSSWTMAVAAKKEVMESKVIYS
jgi:hypothetical protein